MLKKSLIELLTEEIGIIFSCSNKRLLELGFIPGETFRVVSKLYGMVSVRIGTSTFALNRHEAEQILTLTGS